MSAQHGGRGRPVPQQPGNGTYWTEAIYDVDVLAQEPEGTVCIDDVGTLRQKRYGSSYMPAGWTAQGNGPLTSRELVEDGKRPVYILRVERELFEQPTEAGGA